jgi:uncharacterized protein
LQYAVCGSEPMIVIVMGRVGSGKTSLAGALGRELGWKVFSSDRTRKELAGVPLYRRGTAVARRRLYTEAMASRTYGALIQKATKRAREGHGSILDATFGRRRRRDQLKRRLDSKGLSYCFVEVQAPDGVVKQRLAERGGKLRETSDARLEDFEELNRSYESPLDLAPHEFVNVRTSNALETVTTATLRALALRRSSRGAQIGSSSPPN